MREGGREFREHLARRRPRGWRRVYGEMAESLWVIDRVFTGNLRVVDGKYAVDDCQGWWKPQRAGTGKGMCRCGPVSARFW